MKDEKFRLKTMKRYLKQFPQAEDRLQDIVDLAAQITGVPVAFITLLDKDVQWITVKHGYPVDKMPRNISFCTHTIQQDDIMVVPNALADERFSANPLVTQTPSVKYYAGIALKSADGYNIGTLCVMDIETHQLTIEQLHALKALSRQVSNVMELNMMVENLRKSVHQIEQRNNALKKIAQIQSHEIREPLTSVMGVMNLINMETYPNNQQYLPHLATAVKRLDEKICSIVQMSNKAACL